MEQVLEWYRIFDKNNDLQQETIYKAVLDKLNTIVKVEKLYLFGSFAYGKPTESSDYDFLVVIDETTHKTLNINEKLQKPNGKTSLTIPEINREIHIIFCELDA